MIVVGMTMIMNEEIFLAVQKWRMKYINVWGGGKLEPSDGERNDNGSLFVAEGYCLLSKLNLLEPNDSVRFDQMAELITKNKGNYSRSPTSKLMEAHDNYTAMVYMALLFNRREIIRDICDWGRAHIFTEVKFIQKKNMKETIGYFALCLLAKHLKLWYYNDQDPEKQKIEACRQPGDVAFYQICNNEIPSLFFFIYLVIGIYTSGGGLLTWLRIEALQLHGARHLPRWMYGVLHWTMSDWLYRWLKQDMFSNHFRGYFLHRDHPFSVLSKYIFQ